MQDPGVSGYRKLILWQEAKNLVLLVYKLTDTLPKSEEFGLKSQMRRAAVSVLANITEGWLRRSVRDKQRYLEISEGSLLELDCEAEVVYEVGFWNEERYGLFVNQKAKVGFLMHRYRQKVV